MQKPELGYVKIDDLGNCECVPGFQANEDRNRECTMPGGEIVENFEDEIAGETLGTTIDLDVDVDDEIKSMWFQSRKT